MTEFLKSVKADLLDRRLLPLVALVAVALVGAVAYVALSGGGSSAPPHVAAVLTPVSPGGVGLATSQAVTSSGRAVAETANGTTQQRHGAAHDPFAPLPGSVTTVTAASTSSTLKGAASSSSAGSGAKTEPSKPAASSPSSTGSSGSSQPAPSKPKPKTLYKVAVQFGVLPSGTAPANAVLQSYLDLSKATPLPSAKEKLIEFLGVTVAGSSRSASFAIDAELLPSPTGAASCLPSTAQCKVIDLKEGKTEQLLYLAPNGTSVTYELRVVSIVSSTASSASVNSVLRAQSDAAGRLLGGGPLSLAGLHYSSLAGVLVFGGAHASSAHAAARHQR